MDFIERKIEKPREHRRISAQAHGSRFIIPEAEMRGEAAFPDDRLHRAIEYIHELRRVLAVRVATHARLIDGDFAAPGFHQRDKLGADNRKQRLGQRRAVGILRIGEQPSAERIWSRHRGLQRRKRSGCRLRMSGEPLEPLELLDHTQTARCAQFASDWMLSALIVRRRAKAPRRRGLELDTLDVAVKRKIKIQPRLLAIRDDIEPRSELIIYRADHRIILNLRDVILPKLTKILAGKFKP